MAKDPAKEAVDTAKKVGKSEKSRTAGQVPGGSGRTGPFYEAVAEVKASTPKTWQKALKQEAK